MKVGYVRVSTVDQNEARQIEAMKTDGVEKIYMDKKSGKDFNRPEYQRMIASLQKGDILVRRTAQFSFHKCICNSCWRKGTNFCKT